MYGDVDFMLSIWNVSASNANSFVQHLFYVHVIAFLCIQKFQVGCIHFRIVYPCSEYQNSLNFISTPFLLQNQHQFYRNYLKGYSNMRIHFKMSMHFCVSFLELGVSVSVSDIHTYVPYTHSTRKHCFSLDNNVWMFNCFENHFMHSQQ